MKTRRKVDRLGGLLLAAGIPLATTVAAYGQSLVEIEEMIVSSRAREESLQDVPISVSVVSGDVIDEAGIENIQNRTSDLDPAHRSDAFAKTNLALTFYRVGVP